MARLRRVFIDTSELYPFTMMDVLLTMAEDLLFTWVWTDEVLDEWERVIVEDGLRTPESARSVTDAVRRYFGRYRIDPARYRDRVTGDLSLDPDDRVHAAACIHGDVDVLVTHNLKDYRAAPIAAAAVAVMTADDFLCELLARRPAATAESFARAASRKRNPPMTATELADRIAGAGAAGFAQRVLRRPEP